MSLQLIYGRVYSKCFSFCHFFSLNRVKKNLAARLEAEAEEMRVIEVF